MRVKDFILIFLSNLDKDIIFYYKSKKVKIKDIVVLETLITEIGVVVFLEEI